MRAALAPRAQRRPTSHQPGPRLKPRQRRRADPLPMGEQPVPLGPAVAGGEGGGVEGGRLTHDQVLGLVRDFFVLTFEFRRQRRPEPSFRGSTEGFHRRTGRRRKPPAAPPTVAAWRAGGCWAGWGAGCGRRRRGGRSGRRRGLPATGSGRATEGRGGKRRGCGGEGREERGQRGPGPCCSPGVMDASAGRSPRRPLPLGAPLVSTVWRGLWVKPVGSAPGSLHVRRWWVGPRFTSGGTQTLVIAPGCVGAVAGDARLQPKHLCFIVKRLGLLCFESPWPAVTISHVRSLIVWLNTPFHCTCRGLRRIQAFLSPLKNYGSTVSCLAVNVKSESCWGWKGAQEVSSLTRSQ